MRDKRWRQRHGGQWPRERRPGGVAVWAGARAGLTGLACCFNVPDRVWVWLQAGLSRYLALCWGCFARLLCWSEALSWLRRFALLAVMIESRQLVAHDSYCMLQSASVPAIACYSV